MNFFLKSILIILLFPQLALSNGLNDIVHLSVGAGCLFISYKLGKEAKKEYNKENTILKQTSHVIQNASEAIEKKVDQVINSLSVDTMPESKNIEKRVNNLLKTTEEFVETTYKVGERWWSRYHKVATFGAAAVIVGFVGLDEFAECLKEL